MNKQRIMTVVGTRPEVIKMAPVVRALSARSATFESVVVTTAQHREMLDQAFHSFGFRPEVDLALMAPDQALSDFLCRSLSSLTALLAERRPDVVLVQGDTTTVLTTALAGFYTGVCVGHVEAGLRSFDRMDPFPEEMNRRMVSAVADLHFAPTDRARGNLLREGVPASSIHVTGNTVVDALRLTPHRNGFECHEVAAAVEALAGRRMLLVTAHRRESHGERLESICRAVRTLAENHDDIGVIFPVHLNPNVRRVVRERLGAVANVHLVEPVSYADLLRLMERAYLILTDSGGIQEEAPSFGKPVLILREVTERPEVIECGAGRLVGTNDERIVFEVERLLCHGAAYEAMRSAGNPFGDGFAAERIVDVLARRA